MGINSNIEWTHHTFNPWRGCTKVSEGCKHCYAETMSKRNPSVLGVWGVRGRRVVAAESYWAQPIKWDMTARKAGERHRVFCASLADVFEGPETMPAESWQAVNEARKRLFTLIETTPSLDWLLLTKRPQHVNALVPPHWHESWPYNAWLGTSVEDQKAADERIPALLQVHADVRFLSCEPLLGSVDIAKWLTRYAEFWTQDPTGEEYTHFHGVDWVIAGGESGAAARPMQPAWARGLRDQCKAAGVPFFFKQWGEYLALDHASATGVKVSIIDTMNANSIGGGMLKVGKHKAGRLLDGAEYSEMPR